ncbi:SAM-dependent DNA methyltransferase [Brevibacillus sp. SYP-B805]|uniref:HsdM family class I SAM-dependent methyltransferase n=1 Tax=Brevibacillus sp. SYP-B805 TaxID=1578199 RepID=UPI0013EB98BB|nr:N-6 DNA methylase [Brevibacillus sp. SYP-B805]NGQ95473.1 SAM-dependent DNA methyltransferase [Brevibacillus sp. SYP-B805]
MDRKRWQANVRSMEIVAKPRDEITAEDIEFLRENYTSMGGLLPKGFNGGAFFTPTHVARFVVEALAGLSDGFKPGARVLEPSCGSGVFIEHIPNHCEITGLELDSTSAKVSSLIYPHAEIIEGNALEHDRRDYYDYVIGNPPYGETVEVEDGSDWITLSKSKGKWRGKSENAFIEFAIRAAKPGGWIAYILPKGISFSQQAEKVRRLMYDACWHIATIQLPGETFQHVGTTVPTQILIMRKVTPNARRVKSTRLDAEFFEGQPPVFMAEVRDIGWDAKGHSTDKWGDGLTQLDELLDAFTDGGLVRENLYPHEPSWVARGGGVTAYMFPQDGCSGQRDAESYFRKPERDTALLMWNEMTLGIGEEINGESTWDFDWMDRIVAEYYARGGGLTSESAE